MDSLSSNSGTICSFDNEMPKLLEVKGGFFKRLSYRGIVKKSKEFYNAYVKKCNEYNTYMDFFTPLVWYLIGCGYGYSKTLKYLSQVRGSIIEHLKKTVPLDLMRDLESDNIS